MNEIVVLIVPTDLPCYIARVPKDFKFFRKIVYGIPEIKLIDDNAFIFNPSDRELYYEPNCDYNGNEIYGLFVISAYDDNGEFRSLTDEELNKWYSIFG